MQLGKFFRWPFAATPKPAVEEKKPEVTDGAKAKAPSGEVGWSESLLYARSTWPKYNPDELIGLKGAKVYKKMMTDEQVKAVVRFKRDAITGRRYYFEFDKEDAENAARTADQAPKIESDSSEEGLDDDSKSNVGNKSSQPTGKNTTKPASTKAGNYRRTFDAGPPPSATELPDETMGEEDGEGNPPSGEEVGALTPEQEQKIRVFEEIAKQIEGSFRDAINGIMSAMWNGFSLSEKVFKDIEVDGKTWIGLEKIALKPFDTFCFHSDQYGNIKKVTQKFEGYEQTFSPNEIKERFVYHVQNPEVDQHYGQSELREAYRAWFSKDMIIRFYNIHLERHASGFVWIAPKEGKTITVGTQEYNQLVSLISNLSAKTAVILPNDVELHYQAPANTDAYERAVGLHDKSIAKALLVPNLLGISEQGQTGSYAQSQTQLEAFLWTLDAETARLEETLNEQVFKPLGEINFGSGPYPRFRFKPISDALKLQIIKTWKELVQAGAVKATDTDESHLRELLDFPDAGIDLNPPPMLGVDENGNPIAGDPAANGEGGGSKAKPSGTKPPGAKKKPIGKDKSDKEPGFTDETVGGRRKVRIDNAVFARAVKRVDFAVIENRGAMITGATAAKVSDTLRDGLADILAFIYENDLFNNPDKVAEIKLGARAMTRIRKAVEAGLKEAWGVGANHARNELEKARGGRFAVDELRLKDEAAQKFLESRSYTVAGDLADNTRKKVVTVLYNGIKGGWPLKEIADRIEEEVGVGVLPHVNTTIRTVVFEAINEARYELFASPEMEGFVEALEFSAILDGKTTEICQHMDERVYPVNDPVWERYTPPLHFNCRSLLIAVTVRDKWDRSPEPELDPQEGFGGG